MKLVNWMSIAVVTLVVTSALGQAGDRPLSSTAFSDPDHAVRATALGELDAQLKADPRHAGASIEKARYLDAALEAGEYEAVADLSLQCINSQADRMFELGYFMPRRIAALRALKRNDEALAAAKSYYNIATMVDTAKAIDTLAQCLDAVHPDDPSIAKRFKLQQFAGGTTQPSATDPALGESVLKSIVVDPKIYSDDIIKTERSADWRRLGQANLLLLQDKPADAKVVFESLTHSRNATIAEAAKESLARAAKAETGTVGAGNAVLIANQTAAGNH